MRTNQAEQALNRRISFSPIADANAGLSILLTASYKRGKMTALGLGEYR